VLPDLAGKRGGGQRRSPLQSGLPGQLAKVLEAFPRQDNESALAYARRLNLASQQGHVGARVNDQPLSLAQLASLSGATESHLRQDPQLFPLPEELAPVRRAFPIQDNEKPIAYARRLNLASQQGQAGTRVNDQPLSLAQLASLSGVREANLRWDPKLFPLPEELEPVRLAFPRQAHESGMAYARRLNLASQQGKVGARVNDQPLSLSQLASLSGATESNLRQDPQLFPLPEELAPVRQAFPRQDNEKPLVYARRLNLASQQGQGGARVNDQPLSLAQLASLSGATESDLRQDRQLFPLPEELAPVRRAFPRQDKESANAYARRLNVASQQGQRGARVNDQPLSLAQLASLSGVTEANLRQDPQLFPLPGELAPVRRAFPRQAKEKASEYARRLSLASQQGQAGTRVNDQPLSLAQLARLSGAREADLRRLLRAK
jgi:acetyl-CoA carboxylase beta subunit